MLYFITFFAQQLFNYFTETYQGDHLKALSLKEQLLLEAEHHPSILLRFFFKQLLKKMEQGIKLSSYLKYLGLTEPLQAIQLVDLYKMIEILGLKHTRSYPFMNLIRLSILIGLPFIIAIPCFKQHTVWILPFFLILLSINQYAWIDYKIHLLKIYLWLKNPIDYCILKGGIPQPTFIHQQQDLTIWLKSFELTQDLKKAAQLYATYYRYHGLRKAQRSRQQIVLLIDIMTLIFFWNMLDATFSQLYSTSLDSLL
jgi:hypothetical protein